MRWHLFSFALIIVVFAAAYTVLTPYGHGIGQDPQARSTVTFQTGIYFSIVTFSSLGYGDMHPMGFSKVLACMEVLLGLASIGIMIARVTSRRLSHHVSRLFSSDAQDRLETIATELERIPHHFRRIMPQIDSAYLTTPGLSASPATETPTVVKEVAGLVSDLRSRCVHLHDYWFAELAQGDYFQIAPATGVERVAKVLDAAFFSLAQFIVGLPPQARVDILDQGTRRQISRAIDSQLQICQLAHRHPDHEIRSLFQGSRATCRQLHENYFAVPEFPESQPDQVLSGTDLPQELSEEHK